MQSIKKRLVNLSNSRDVFELNKVFEILFNTQVLSSAGLAIFGAASPLVKAVNAFTAVVSGMLVNKIAGTTLTALSGPSIAVGAFVAYFHTIDGVGNLYTYPGVQGATLTGVQLPLVPETPVQAVIGVTIVQNGSAGAFVPGITALDTAGLVVTYNSTVGPFFPIQLL